MILKDKVTRDRDKKKLTITIGFLDPINIPMNNFTTKFGWEVQNPGGCNNPLVVNVGRNSLVVGELTNYNVHA